MKCDHTDYDDYFEKCNDCGATADEIVQLENIDAETLNKLHELVFEKEYNPKHEDDYSNAGGFYAHWTTYSTDEKLELLTEVLAK